MAFILIGVFITGFCLSWLGLDYFLAHRAGIKKRLEDVGNLNRPHNLAGVEEELQENLAERVFKPLLGYASVLTQRFTPVRKTEFIEKKLDYAGRPFGWDASTFVTIQYAVAVGIAIIGYLLSVFAFRAAFGNQLLTFIGCFFGGYWLVDLILRSKISKRQVQIRKELPDLLDLMTVSIESGLGFDAAMQRVVQKAKGPLAEEFNVCLQEMRIGRTRREALKELSQRNGVDDLSRFVESIVQADQLGVSLGNVLRAQSDQMRIIRRQRIEEQAMKAPIKMLIPMVIFIFPCIFIVALAPAILTLVETL